MITYLPPEDPNSEVEGGVLRCVIEADVDPSNETLRCPGENEDYLWKTLSEELYEIFRDIAETQDHAAGSFSRRCDRVRLMPGSTLRDRSSRESASSSYKALRAACCTAAAGTGR